MNKLSRDAETTPAVLENGILLVDPDYCISSWQANCIRCSALPFCHVIVLFQFLQLLHQQFYTNVEVHKLFFQLEKKKKREIRVLKLERNVLTLDLWMVFALHFQWLKSSWLSRWKIILGFNLYTACPAQPKRAPKSLQPALQRRDRWMCASITPVRDLWKYST